MEVVELLLENGAEPNMKDDDGSTPLHAACIRGNLEVVRLLLAHGAEVGMRNKKNESALHCLVERLD